MGIDVNYLSAYVITWDMVGFEAFFCFVLDVV